MKCNNCGFENKESAKFCSKCGQSLEYVPPKEGSSNSKLIIAALIIVIVILAGSIGYFALNNMQSGDSQLQASTSSDNTSVSAGESGDSQGATTQSISKTESETKDWELIGSYSGSGSGSQSISVPAGEIMIKLSAYPIKNYATNHLYVTGSNGESAGVDWGSTSAVETRSNSLSYSSSSPQTFTIDYYETVSWQVEFYRYQ
ncbi:MAG: zinc ribbon domain-containing protein [Methanobrevibacter sp.]|uniref:zinc ribbon domain-containing protein n=1 Tax=Methanobrevibacter sp. TaxID=66852 RepID=UPI0025D237E9|nr:zinc ribbon domain-containing protein [Methanobrevibacter sp.]MBR0271875.1 zinc ribbon domain-containing protein [Methanobrevibacter sp.]